MFNLRNLQVTVGLAVALTILSAASMVTAQVTATSGDPKAIAAIAASVAEIDRDSRRYTVTTHRLLGYSTEGGELRGLFEGMVLRRLTVQLYGESGRADEDLYYSGDELAFVRQVTELYDQPLSGRVRVRIEHAEAS